MKHTLQTLFIMILGMTQTTNSADFKICKKTKDLVELKKIIPSVILDLRYATRDNFVHQIVYSSNRCFIHKDAAQALVKVVKELNAQGLTLKVWDTFRPMMAQKKFWEICPDERYVGNPAKGGRHTRGTAIDCTLVDLKTGKELEMGTGFDDFTESAWPSCTTVSQTAQTNRKILQTAMNHQGFTGVKCEWWHFDFKEWSNYPVLDVDFQDLA